MLSTFLFINFDAYNIQPLKHSCLLITPVIQLLPLNDKSIKSKLQMQNNKLYDEGEKSPRFVVEMACFQFCALTPLLGHSNHNDSNAI